MSQSLWSTPEVVMIHPRSRYDPYQKSLWSTPEVIMTHCSTTLVVIMIHPSTILVVKTDV